MIRKIPRKRKKADSLENPIGDLYLELLHWLYDKEDRKKAQEVAWRLEAVLAKQPEVAQSIRGEEIRSLFAELRGDLSEAIQARECEIRKIYELHSLAKDKPGWEYVLKQYDYGDLSDRLDLLAILYAEQGNIDRAIQTLHESRQFCVARSIPFDGEDLLKEFEQARQTLPDAARQSPEPDDG